jgi:hypothetical protein
MIFSFVTLWYIAQNPKSDYILNQFNLVHILMTYFSKIHY